MLKIFTKPKTAFSLFSLLVLACSCCRADEQAAKIVSQRPIEEIWDPAKYISIDEIRPQMQAYCLTTYKGTDIEKFSLDVLSVVLNITPGRDAILVQGTDERFIHTGPVWGCSGSPVYIDGRLAGALGRVVQFSKDPLYIVTPIKEMLRVGQVSSFEKKTAQVSLKSEPLKGDWEPGFGFDFSKPIDFAEIDRQIKTCRPSGKNLPGGLAVLPSPLITCGLPAEVCEHLNASIESFGLVAVPGISGGKAPNSVWQADDIQLAPGACLTVPLVTGDLEMTIIGTVTEVVGDKVYGFGHSLLGYGEVDLPMATGEVHTVASNVMRSFKIASPVEIVGALRVDESTGVLGQIGAKAKMIPLVIKVDRYNDSRQRVYNCRIVDNQLLTPSMLRSAVAGATVMLGSLPPQNTVEYRVTISTDKAGPFTFENISTDVGLDEMLREGAGSVAILLNNPYQRVDISSIDFDVRITSKNVSSKIWSVDLSDSKIKAGQQLDIDVVVETFLAEKEKYRCSLQIPPELEPGEYDLLICGGYGYREFLSKAAPYKFIPQNFDTLVEAMKNILTIDRDKLYCILVLPPGGVALEKAELPDLPATKTLLLQDAKRALTTLPYQHWLEESLPTGTIITDKKVMCITVEEQE